MRVPYTAVALLKFNAEGYNTAANVTLEVHDETGTSYAEIFTAKVGGSPIPQPYSFDSDGKRSFWIEPGTYLVTANGTESHLVEIGAAGDVTADVGFLEDRIDGLELEIDALQAGAVTSFNGRNGPAITPVIDDYSAFYASKAQGTKADTAMQPGATAADSLLLEGNNSAYHLAWSNFTGIPSPTITLTGDVSGTGTMTELGNVTITTESLGGGGEGITAEEIQDIIGGMVSGNVESGIDVVYNDAANRFDFTVTNSPLLGGNNPAYYLAWSNFTGVPSPTITLTGDVNGTATMTSLGNVTISTTAIGGGGDGITAEEIEDIVGAMLSGNVETGITVTYNDAGSKINFVVNDSPLLQGQNGAYYLAWANVTGKPSPTITLTGDVTGTGTMNSLGNVTIETESLGSGGSTITAEEIQDIVGQLVATGNTESGITVTYNDASNRLDFVVNDSPLLQGQNGAYYRNWANITNKPDPTITLTGGATGTATMTDMGNASMLVTVHGDQHLHTTDYITGIGPYVDGKIAGAVTGNTETGITVTAASGKLNFVVNDSPLLGGQNGAYYRNWSNITNKPQPLIQITGAVSGGVTQMLGGDISIATTMNAHNHTTAQVTGLLPYIQDSVGAMVSGNTETGIAVTYNSTAKKLNFAVSGGSASSVSWANVTNKPEYAIQFSGAITGGAMVTVGNDVIMSTTLNAHSHSTGQISGLQEYIEDVVGAMVTGNTETNITVSYDDTAGKINFVASGGGSTITNYVTTNTTQSITGLKTFTQRVTATSFNVSSTIRDKTDVREFKAGAEFDLLRPVKYTRISTGEHETGFIAEEMAQIYPQFVGHDEQGRVSGIDYSKMVAVLVSKVQQLEARLEAVEAAQ